MSILRMNDLSKKQGDRWILRNLFFKLNERERVGLIGASGVGKTTFLRLLLGEIEPDGGTIERDVKRIGYFSQTSQLDSSRTVLEEMLDVFASVIALETELDALAFRLQTAREPELSRLIEEQARLHERMEHLDGWNYLNKIETVLTKLGFVSDDPSTGSGQRFDKPISELSGGWRNKAALAKLLLTEPDALLLDEPTNHLDVSATEWLEEYLQKYRGSFILVSHDRYFLERAVTRIVEIENYDLQLYPGTYADYVRERRARLKTIVREFRAQEEELLAQEEQSIAENRRKRAELSDRAKRKLTTIRKKSDAIREVGTIRLDAFSQGRSPQGILELDRLTVSIGGQTLVRDLTMLVGRGDKIGVIGPNGCGKTTLLRTLYGDLEPEGGRMKFGKGVRVAYVDQFRQGLEDEKTVFDILGGVNDGIAQKRKKELLAAFFFGKLDLKKRVRELSGGERCRLLLAEALRFGANLLLFDEPTNDLDIHSIRVLERAILDLSGAAFLVTHDRFFLDKVANSLLIFEKNGNVRHFQGNYAMYQGSSVADC